MGSSFFATFVILTTLFIILSSLGYGLFYLLFKQSGSNQTLMALSIRIGLSVALFIGLLISIYLGWIVPNPPQLFTVP